MHAINTVVKIVDLYCLVMINFLLRLIRKLLIGKSWGDFLSKKKDQTYTQVP